MDVMGTVERYIRGVNKELREELNVKHNKKDIKLFQLKRKVFIEEDVFKYFYPFCMINCSILTGVIFRHHSPFAIAASVVCMAEYVYFVFAFPIESWHFHKRALSRELEYS